MNKRKRCAILLVLGALLALPAWADFEILIDARRRERLDHFGEADRCGHLGAQQRSNALCRVVGCRFDVGHDGHRRRPERDLCKLGLEPRSSGLHQ